ncbi:RHS repeat protein [Diaphorobacter aerolatus]|uniref:RHS repeat protein n=1 Tax=Diaphorobacter aerolatus TaxID=1288495 RepID=A0A7H0GM46_9BURK|nr:RHS repeat protein [Diaphorobacter aerolatus]QNP49362.1 RHS repeat protein [Diaphorobacter aerolatus]
MAVYLTHDPHAADLPLRPLVRYEYSPRGELVAVHGRDASQVRAFQYHPQWPGRMTAHAYAGRPAVRYVYNEAGKVVEQLRQGALSYRFDYAQDSTTVTDSLGRVSIYHFRGEGGLRRVVKLQEADGGVTQSRFDDSGRLLASIDALGRETHYELDVATGGLLSITQPDGLQSRFSYNAQGQIEQSTRPNGASDRFAYDAMARLASVTDALGHVTRYHYADERSEQPRSIEDARGGQKHLAWTSAGQLCSYTDCSGSVTRYRYDRWGKPRRRRARKARRPGRTTTSGAASLPERMVWAKPPAMRTTKQAISPASPRPMATSCSSSATSRASPGSITTAATPSGSTTTMRDAWCA